MSDPLHPPTEAIEAEQSRWQQAIYKLVCETTGSDVIDGAGCDSGDPLDLSLAEISQGMAHFANHAYDLENELVEYLALEVAGESIPTEDGEWEELRGAFASRAINAADRLVALNRWERHPSKPGLYRPKPDHFAQPGKKVGEARP